MSNNQKREFLPVPKGEYVATLSDAEIVKFKNGSGRKLALRFKTLVGEDEKLVFHDLPIKHTSAKYMEFGRKGADILLQALGVAEGLKGVDDDMGAILDYVGNELVISVDIQEGSEYTDKEGNVKMGKDRNVIRTFKTR